MTGFWQLACAAMPTGDDRWLCVSSSASVSMSRALAALDEPAFELMHEP